MRTRAISLYLALRSFAAPPRIGGSEQETETVIPSHLSPSPFGSENFVLLPFSDRRWGLCPSLGGFYSPPSSSSPLTRSNLCLPRFLPLLFFSPYLLIFCLSSLDLQFLLFSFNSFDAFRLWVSLGFSIVPGFLNLGVFGYRDQDLRNFALLLCWSPMGDLMSSFCFFWRGFLVMLSCLNWRFCSDLVCGV